MSVAAGSARRLAHQRGVTGAHLGAEACLTAKDAKRAYRYANGEEGKVEPMGVEPTTS